MERATRTMRRNAALIVLVALAVVMFGGTALAGHITTNVKSYTGCLVSGDGVIVKVKEGNTPKSACTGGQTEVHLSGGDISTISVTGALTGGGDNGEVTIGLKPEFSLPQGCANGGVAEWNGTAWICGVDDDTKYAAGTGLDLSSSNEFGIEPAYRVKNTPDCSSGQFATGFDGDGGIQCASPSASGLQAYAAQLDATFALAGEQTVLSTNVPAGTYLVFASVELFNEDDEDTSIGWCSIPGYATSGGPQGGAVLGHELDDDDTDLNAGNTESLSLASTMTISQSGGSIELKCTESEANVDISEASLIALKVSALG